ncbi:MAG: hypothetical protein LZF62_240207 [Nitrospira sp.]|nr:MAG: hypothetical protein LZF62_240207 [Nitrospira sp.]
MHDLRTLIRSSHPLIVSETVEEDRVLTRCNPWPPRNGCRCSNGRLREASPDPKKDRASAN